MTEVRSIQYLRGIAALMVVVYHAMRWTPVDFDIGAAGVDLFFVISGFILWTVAAERPVSAQTFLARRWIRVAPLYWVLTAAVAAFSVAYPGLIWDAKPNWNHLLLSLGFIQHLNPDGEPFPIITPGWSLNYEAVFYLLFAVSLLWERRTRLMLLTVLLVSVPLFGILFPSTYYLGANMMFLQFIAGIWLAHSRLEKALLGAKAGLLLTLGGALVLAGLYLFDIYDNLWRPILWGVPAFMIVAGMVSLEASGRTLKIPFLKTLGDASYSIYLAHVVVVQLLTHVLNSGRFTFVPIAVAASLAAGLACHHLLEKPLIGVFRRPKAVLLPSAAA